MSGKSFAAGRTVVAALPEFDRPLSAKIIHENKSGTYRVLLDDGSKVTIPREDVFETLGEYEDAMQSPRKKSPGRAKARGRSPARARPKSKSPARKKSPGRKPATPKSPKVEEAKPVVTSPRRRAAAVKAEVQLKETPTMSLRLRRWEGTPPVKTKMEDVVDSDGEGARASPAKATTTTTAKKVQTEFCGAFGVISMFVLFVGILLTCQLLLRSASLEVRRFDVVALFKGFPKFDLLAAEIFFGFMIGQAVLSMLPIGPVVPAIPGVQGPSSYRCNGLVNAILTLSVVCVLHVYFKIQLSYKQLIEMIPQWTVFATGLGLFRACVAAFRASRLPLSQQNPVLAETGRVYNFCMGKEINPSVGILNIKAAIFKTALIAMLTLHLVLYFALDETQRTPTLMLAMGMINFYIADGLLFERHFYSSFEYTSEGFGLMVALGYALYPFYPLLGTLYIATSRFEVSMYACVGIVTLFLVGYLVYRASNTEKSEFRRNPLNPNFANAETIPTPRGKRLLCSNWWGWVRHPNYVGDMCMHLCWGLVAGLHPIPWILPVSTILLLLHRAHRDNARCKTKYGEAWARYCEKVPYACIPKVY